MTDVLSSESQEDHGLWLKIYPELAELGFSQKTALEFKKGITHLKVPNFIIGAAGYPDSYNLSTTEITTPDRAYILWDAFSTTKKEAVLNLRRPIEDPNTMAAPAVISGASIFEIPLARWNKQSKSWIWTVVRSQDQTPIVSQVSTDELIKITRNPVPVPEYMYNYELNIPEDTPYIIKCSMKVMEERSRRVPFGYDSVMILSNSDREINEARTRVACTLLKILTIEAQATSTPVPRLICNGYQWQVENMHSVARGMSIAPDVICNVILPEGANTMAHGPEMLKQLEHKPNQVVAVSSAEHMLRSGLHLYPQLHEVGINLAYFQAPTPMDKQALSIEHEVQRLNEFLGPAMEKYNTDYVDEWDRWAIPPTVPLWARACTGELPSLDAVSALGMYFRYYLGILGK